MATATNAVAQGYDSGTAFTEGRALGSGSINGAFQGIGSGNAASMVPGYGQSATQTQLFQGGQGQLSGPGVTKVTDCASQVPDADTYRRQECDAVNFVARNPAVRPPFSIDRANDPLIINANNIARNPTMTFTGITAGTSTEQCRVVTDTQPATCATETCNDYHEVTSNFCSTARQITVDQNHLYQCIEQMQTLSNASCFIGQQIAVNTSYNYQCNQTVQGYETLKCRRSSSVTCTGGGDGCDQGGIVPNSWEGDMATTWLPDGAGNYILQFGTIADNYWGGWGAAYDRNLTFEARDVNLITRFALTRAAYDDWLLVKINGTTVYVGPRGGDRLYVIDTGAPINASYCTQNDWGGQWSCYQNSLWGDGVQLIGTYSYCQCNGWDTCTWSCNNDGPPGYVKYGPLPSQYSSPELSTSWNFTLDIDLRQYLKNGSNTIFMRTIVAGGGEGAIQITTRQKCPLNCSVSTNNQCATLEARSQ
ncbi:MAG: hypothetical protein Q8O64_05140 [Sideroxyarcus sp.]|nr:hypothetical protein [Sideroxyarcus sp.]